MKKITKVLFLAGALSVFAVTQSHAQRVFINVRPAEPVRVAPPPAPSRNHIWVEGEWEERGGRYVYKPGYWVVPPHRHARWTPGHWRHFRGGWGWVPGHWR